MTDEKKAWPYDVVDGEPGEVLVWHDDHGNVTMSLLSVNGGPPLVSVCVYERLFREALDARATLNDDIPFVTVMFCNHRLTDATKPMSANDSLMRHYETLDTRTLGITKAAFVVDRDAATSHVTRTFCQARINVIERVLTHRVGPLKKDKTGGE